MRKQAVILLLLLSLFAGIGLQSCSKENIPHSIEVSYSKDIAPIMANYCLTCHSGSAPLANLNLEDYESVRAIGTTGKLVNRMNTSVNPMPPSGLLSAENRQKIKDWINGNYQP